MTSKTMSVGLLALMIISLVKSQTHPESNKQDHIRRRRAQANQGCSNLSSASAFPPLPAECRGVVPTMYGTYHFYGFRLGGEFALDDELNEWDDGMANNAIAGTEYVPWQEGPYYMLAIYSPLGLIRRFCTFNTWDNRTSTCTGVEERDESVTEFLYVQEATFEDGLCKAQTFGITTTKAYVPGVVGTDTLGFNMWVDKVQAYRMCDEYPQRPADTPDASVNFCESQTAASQRNGN